jgi:hypothetical protein
VGLCPIIGTAIGAAVGAFLEWTFGELIYLVAGGADDFVAQETVTLSYDYLKTLSKKGPHKPLVLGLYGGDEGKFELRWHIEFGEGKSKAFAHKFTNWDQFVVGDLTGDARDEVLIVIDEDGPGSNGRFYILDAEGVPLSVFDGYYTANDRVAIGDVTGDDENDIIVASDDGGGKLHIYDHQGEELVYLPSEKFRFTKYDGLAVGNVLIGETKDQILVANDGEKKVYLRNKLGNDFGSFDLNWDFDGCRYTVNHPDSNRHDGFIVGDVLGDEREEIVLVDKSGEDSTVYVYNSYGHYGHDLQTTFEVFLSKHDGIMLADITGNGKKELVIGTDGGDGERGLTLRIYDIETGEQTATRFWPWFTKYDGFASGDIYGPGKDSILVATDEDDIVYIGC